jgi:hypothetical protein
LARLGFCTLRGKKLSDYLRFHGQETDVYLMVIAYEDAEKKTRRFSPLMTVRVKP